jgi:hypothetical protein
MRTRLSLLAAIVLLVGLSSAVSIYLTAENAFEDGLVHQFEHSKRYRHDLEVIGGKANVLADDFYRWFAGLWHGKSLAVTVGWISVIISVGLFLAACNLPSQSRSEGLSDQD